MKTELPSLGLYLKELRIKGKMTLRDVENATNRAISNAYLSQLESGKVNKPSPHILDELSKVYKISYKEIMMVAGYMKSSSKNPVTSGIAFFKQHDLTNSEKEELLTFLQFLRKRRNKNRHEKK